MNNNNRQSPETARKLARLFIYGGIIVVLVLIPLLVSPYVTHIFVITFIYIVAAVSLRTVVISGQYPLAHGAFMGDNILVKALELVILGGIGSIIGMFFAGLLIGSIDAIVPLFSSGALGQAIGLAIIIIILLFRPQGFFGREFE